MSACFTMLAINMVVRRETGLLKRLRLSPLPTWALLAAIFISTTVVALTQVSLILVIGRLGYGVQFPKNWLAFALALFVGIACFTAMGVAISTSCKPRDGEGDEHCLLPAPLPLGTLVSHTRAFGARHVLEILSRVSHAPSSCGTLWPATGRVALGVEGLGRDCRVGCRDGFYRASSFSLVAAARLAPRRYRY